MDTSAVTDEDSSGDNTDEVAAHVALHCGHIGLYSSNEYMCTSLE